jgi:hypothetical protein
MKLRVKNKQNKKLPSTKLHKNRWIFLKLADWGNVFILKLVLFISSF